MYLVVGLGNPGNRYRGNRHNVGFMIIDRMAERNQSPAFREKFDGVFAKLETGAHEVVLLKPMTYMNKSGESVQKAQAFFKVDAAHTVVVHDELDLPFGTSRVKVGGGAAGHNGIKSITQHSGPDFVRVRIGIGRPEKGSTENFVLGDFSTTERATLPEVIDTAADSIMAIVEHGVSYAMNRFNQKAPLRSSP